VLLPHSRMKSLSLLEFAGALGVVSLSARLHAAVDRFDVLVRQIRGKSLARGYDRRERYPAQRY